MPSQLTPQTDEAPRGTYGLILACFFLSGLAALIYQTAWTRQFAFVFGTSELAIATVLAAYMGGLAAGAAVAARFAPLVRRPVLVYGLLELAIALSALAVPLGIRAARGLHVAWFAVSGAPPAEGGVASALFYLSCSFVILLVPTSLMGATLPLLARHAVRRSSEIGSRIAILYAINTLGAVVGTVFAGFVLLPAIGLSSTIWVAVAANALVFAIAARVARLIPPRPEPAKGPARPTGEDEPAGPARAGDPDVGFAHGHRILPLIAISGTVSFSYEILWSRLLGQILGGSVYAFSTMLASFLIGIALGSALASRLAATRETAARAFGWAQVAIAVLSFAAFRALDGLPALVSSIGRAGDLRLLADATAAGAILLPSTIAIGATFPLAVRMLALAPEEASAASARVYAWNTVGAIVGAVGAGFFVIPALGFAGTLTLAAAMSLGLALCNAYWFLNLRGGAGFAACALLIALAFVRPEPPWDLLRTSPFSLKPAPGEILYYAVGRGATVMVREEQGSYRISTNGLPESAVLPPGGRAGRFGLTLWLGSLPSLLRPDATEILVVGLGGGVVLEWVPSGIERVDVIELESEVVEANRTIGPRRRKDPLVDPRINVIVNDARGALALTDRRYDAIVSQPSHPWTAGASHLYTREFFQLAREHLNDDGVLVQWMGLPFVDRELLQTLIATLGDVFAHVQVYLPARGGAIFVGSMGPLEPLATLDRALAGRRREFAPLGIYGPEDVLAALVLDGEGARAFAGSAPINTDDRNLLQMRSPRLIRSSLRPLDVDALFAPWDPALGTAERIDRIYLVRRLLASGAVARARQIAKQIDDPARRAIAMGLVLIHEGDYTGGTERLQRGYARDPSQREARVKLLRIQRKLQADQIPNHPLAQGDLAPQTRRVLDGWALELRGDWDALEAMDDELRGVWSHDPVFGDAARLRVRWRLESDNPQRAAEALSILDAMIPVAGTLPDLLLHARASLQAGHPLGALNTLFGIGQQLDAPRHVEVAREALSLLQRIPPGGSDPGQLLRLASLLRKVSGQATAGDGDARRLQGAQQAGPNAESARQREP